MTAFLISEADFEKIKGFIGQEYWENADFSQQLGYWIPSGLLEKRDFGITPILEASDIPVFYGNVPINRAAFRERLTCFCKSREDGSNIKAISILPLYWYEAQYFEFKRCFRYHAPDDQERYWRIISRKTDIDWLLGCWGVQSGLIQWLAHNEIDTAMSFTRARPLKSPL